MDDSQFRRFEIKLLIASVVIGGLSAVISSMLGLYGVYLGSEAIRQTERLESMKMRPLLVDEYRSDSSEAWGLTTKNIGYGPAKVLAVTIGYIRADGTSVWLKYGDGHSATGIDLFEFLGVSGINSEAFSLPDSEKADRLVFVNWPWIGAHYGPGESFSLISIPSDKVMPAEWRAEFGNPLKQVLKSLCLGIDYESMDGVVTSGFNDSQKCKALDLSEVNRLN